MKKAGFHTYRYEWWHFQHYTKNTCAPTSNQSTSKSS
ncbi:MAG: hypothetical protein E7081_04940 [Bacteroidales bacterium]|nr:hypothetical protein [Bacteroidales bacterium]